MRQCVFSIRFAKSRQNGPEMVAMGQMRQRKSSWKLPCVGQLCHRDWHVVQCVWFTSLVLTFPWGCQLKQIFRDCHVPALTHFPFAGSPGFKSTLQSNSGTQTWRCPGLGFWSCPTKSLAFWKGIKPTSRRARMPTSFGATPCGWSV